MGVLHRVMSAGRGVPARIGLGSLVALLGAALLSCGDPRPEPAPGSEPGPGAGSASTAAEFSATTIAQLPATLTGFDVASKGKELLVADRRGVVWRLVREQVDGSMVPRLDPDPVLDISSRVSLVGERGLFDLKVTPEGESFVVNYTDVDDGAITVELFAYGRGGRVDPDSGTTLLRLPHPYAWHHGGSLAFEPDGDLLVSIGDMEFRQIGLPGPQDPELLLGGILRVPAVVARGQQPDWQPAPSDMIARGLRNPWRISLDAAAGQLWIGDVGLDRVEEIDVVDLPEPGADPYNFGWPYFEGSAPHAGAAPPDVSLRVPIHERSHDEGVCGVVAGFVYDGSAVPDLRGRFLYADLCVPEVRALEVSEGRVVSDRVVARLPEPIVSIGEGPDGVPYALGGAGTLMRLDPSWWHPPPLRERPRDGSGPRQLQSSGDCSGLTMILLTLQEFGQMEPAQLREALGSANQRFAETVPGLPPETASQGKVIQAAFVELARQLESADWDVGSPQMLPVRADLEAGRNQFEGLPEAIAHVVDSECK